MTQQNISKDTNPVTAKTLRDAYNQILQRTDSAAEQIGRKVKVVDMGETQKKIEEAMVSISRVTRKDSKVHSWLTKWLPSSVFEKAADELATKSVEGKSVYEISKNLMEAVVSKKNDVENILDDLVGLHDTMLGAHLELGYIVEGINENMDSFSDAEKIRMKGLKSEILLQMKTHEHNIISSKGALQAAESTVMKLSETLPSIRAQINDSMSIRGALRELESLNKICDTVTTISGAIQLENQAVMEEQLMVVLEKSVISNSELARIETITSNQRNLHNKLTAKVQEINNRRDDAIKRLESGSENLIEHKTWEGSSLAYDNRDE